MLENRSRRIGLLSEMDFIGKSLMLAFILESGL